MAATQWRIYQGCQLFSCTPAELDEIPAQTIDWQLAIHEMVGDIEEQEMNRGR